MSASDNQGEKAHFAKKVGSFASATLVSRILGYWRDALVAAYFGGGGLTDSFYSAFKIPNLLRRFMAEGAFTAAFVPVFTDTLHKKGHGEAHRLFNAVMSGMTVLLLAIVALGIVFAPEITHLMSWGFVDDPAKFDLTTRLTRLIFPFLLLISLASIIAAVLNASGKFFVAAVAPAGLSIGEILFVLLLATRVASPIQGLALAAVVGVGIHLVWQLPALYREGYSLKLAKPFNHPDVRGIFVMMVPAMIGLCADQVNAFVDQLCASFLRDGSITALYNSNRVMQLPLALFGVAVSSVALPAMSRFISLGDEKSFKETLGFSVRIANFVLVPSFVGLAVLGLPIVQLLFEHGRFTLANSQMTYYALVPTAAGLPAFSTVKILASAFYAKKDTATPMKIAFAAMFVNVIGDVLMMWKWEVAGLSLATTLSAWFQVGVLFYYLRKKMGLVGGREIVKSFLYGSLAGALMGLVCAELAFHLLRHWPLLLRTSIAVAVGSAFYFGLAKLLKIPEYKHLKSMLARRRVA
jgi:putative peptidoglycan lipid II flippase